MTTIDPELNKLINDIAKKHFSIDTLETRNRDDLDFHNVSVWDIKHALLETYNLGKLQETALSGCQCITSYQLEQHTCPYTMEIYGEDKQCTCCEQCTMNCAMAI